jgi:hypothetical protein
LRFPCRRCYILIIPVVNIILYLAIQFFQRHMQIKRGTVTAPRSSP